MKNTTCAYCGTKLSDEQVRRQRAYCSIDCANKDPAKRERYSAWLRQRWQAWKQSGSIPTMTPEARHKRSQARSVADKARWQRWKDAGIVPPTHSEAANEKRKKKV